MKKMIAAERRRRIEEIISSNGSLHIGETAEFFNVSTETIRKDLIYLNDTGAVKKSFGGAIAVNEFTERSVNSRMMENSDKKIRIAKQAIDYIVDKKVIYIDSGSTALEFAKLLSKNQQNKDEIAVITNSFAAVNYLMNASVTVYFIGGEISKETMATHGLWTLKAISTVKIDIAILGSSGFQSHTGPSSKTFTDAQTKIEVMRNSNINIVLADSTKFSTNAVVQYADWNQVDVFITDTDAPKELVDLCMEQTKVVLA